MKSKKICTISIVFSIVLAASFVNIDLNTNPKLTDNMIHLSSKPMQSVLFTVGTFEGPSDLDPIHAWDSGTYLVIDQVCEGLFALNLSDPEMAIIPNLALSGSWNSMGTEYTCILRQGVIFHDGAPFNADAVIFNWNRMDWALNVTGTNTDIITKLHGLYEFPDGRPIVSSITKNNDYNITFVLNDPYTALESLLCFSGSYMLSPSSTPAEAYIDTSTGDLVGTGPFVYDNYTVDTEVNFHAFNNYWKGKANITAMKYQIINDATTRNNAILNGSIHFLNGAMSSLFPTFKADPNITFLNTSTTGSSVYYLAMNNHKINRTFREAISYAIDYDYIINELQDSTVKRLKSPIANGLLYNNDTLDVPILNLTRARLVMQSMGFGIGFTTDAEWQAASFENFNYTYNIGNDFREDLFVLLQDNLDLIGIDVDDAGMSWGDFLDRAYGYAPGGYNKLELVWIGWGADFNDPSNVINVLFTNETVNNNAAQYNGYAAAIEAGRNPLNVNDNVQLLMETALSETDPVAREALYDRIQELLIEEDYPWAWGYSGYIYHVFNQHLIGFQQNALNKFYFYPCVWDSEIPILPGSVNIFSDADNPDTDGSFNITWSPSTYTDNYSLYVSSSVITQIDGSVTLLLDEVNDTSYQATGYLDGTYYFLVIARNGNGNTNSSNIMVNVEIEGLPSHFTLSSNAGSPDTDGDFTLNWTPSTNADNYSLYSYSSLITEINGSLTLLLDEVSDLTYDVFDYTNGTYFFAVVAKNVNGTRFSNNIQVIVNIPNPPSAFTLSSNAGNPDTDGDFNLTWTPSANADNYSLYVYSSLITEINGSLTLLLNEVTDLSYEEFNYADGTYYFAVVARNAFGSTLSNNIVIIVAPPSAPTSFTLSSNAGSPDTDGDFTLMWTPSTFADNYSLYVYSSLITEINSSLTLLLYEVTALSYEEFNYADGTYNFIVLAKNAFGTTMSNNLEIIVDVEDYGPEPTPEIPGFELWTLIFTIISVAIGMVLRKKEKIT